MNTYQGVHCAQQRVSRSSPLAHKVVYYTNITLLHILHKDKLYTQVSKKFLQSTNLLSHR
jgi:hypothetical protein